VSVSKVALIWGTFGAGEFDLAEKIIALVGYVPTLVPVGNHGIEKGLGTLLVDSPLSDKSAKSGAPHVMILGLETCSGWCRSMHQISVE
jgi:hypothetical protein